MILHRLACSPLLLIASLFAAPGQADEAYRVGRGDVLDIEVFDEPTLSRLVTVQHGGEIPFPYVGDVQVAGLSTKEIEERLEELLGKDFLVQPQVNVKVKEFQSQWVTVMGEVVRPAKYYLDGRRNLLEILTEAGGFTSSASGEVTITRLNGTFDDGGTNFRVTLHPGMSAGAQKDALTLPVVSGDLISVSGQQFFYVSGEVKRPGSYPLSPGLTVLKALPMAGGLTRFGSRGRVEIIRKASSGESRRIKIDLGEIERGKRPDIPLAPQDIVKVGKRIF